MFPNEHQQILTLSSEDNMRVSGLCPWWKFYDVNQDNEKHRDMVDPELGVSNKQSQKASGNLIWRFLQLFINFFRGSKENSNPPVSAFRSTENCHDNENEKVKNEGAQGSLLWQEDEELRVKKTGSVSGSVHKPNISDLKDKLQYSYRIDPQLSLPLVQHSIPSDLVFQIATTPKKELLEMLEAEKPCLDNTFLQPDIPQKIFLQGDPGSGKSCWCDLLMSSWVENNEFMKQFSLCFKVQLKECKRWIDDVLVECCQKLPGYNHVNEISLHNVLKEEKILIIIEGYEESKSMNEKVADLVRRAGANWSILMTSKTTVEPDLEGLFTTRKRLQKFSTDHVEYLLMHLKDFGLHDNLWKLHNFAGSSPLFMYYVLSAVTETVVPNENGDLKLFDLLERVVKSILSLHSNKENVDVEQLFSKMGKLCFEGLVNGFSKFDNELLRENLEKDLEIFCNCGFILESPIEEAVWIFSSKLLMEFFATKFLRQLWAVKCKTGEGKKSFIRNVLCVSSCVPEYVLQDSPAHPIQDSPPYEKQDSPAYEKQVSPAYEKQDSSNCAKQDSQGDSPTVKLLVGFLPEVLLHFSSERTATVEMTRDMGSVHHSTAFDSVNLLLRICKERINRFDFQKLDEEEDEVKISQLEALFVGILNYLCFDDCTANYEYYHNSYEGTNFLKVLVDDPDKDIIVLTSVLRANAESVIQRIHLEFVYYGYIAALFPVVEKAIQSAIPGFVLKIENFKDVGHFVYDVISAVLGMQCNRAVKIQLLRQIPNDEEVSHVRIYEIPPYSPNCEYGVFVSSLLLKATSCINNSEFETKDEFMKDKENLAERLEKEGIWTESVTVHLDII